MNSLDYLSDRNWDLVHKLVRSTSYAVYYFTSYNIIIIRLSIQPVKYVRPAHPYTREDEYIIMTLCIENCGVFQLPMLSFPTICMIAQGYGWGTH